jgi:hypothetical protein
VLSGRESRCSTDKAASSSANNLRTFLVPDLLELLPSCKLSYSALRFRSESVKMKIYNI